MLTVWIWTILSVVVVGLVSLLGVLTLILKGEVLNKILLWLVSFATGALFGDVFIHLLPEAFRNFGQEKTASFLVLAGLIIFFILEKFIRWHHCHLDAKQHHKPIVVMNLVGDVVHNFIDGMLIGASYLLALPLGITTTLAVVFHEIPQEIGDFGILIHGGLPVKKALLFNFLSGLTAILGAISSLILGPKVVNFAQFLLPITAGGFLYIAGSDLVPALQHENEGRKAFGQLVFIILGVGIMAWLK